MKYKLVNVNKSMIVFVSSDCTQCVLCNCVSVSRTLYSAVALRPTLVWVAFQV